MTRTLSNCFPYRVAAARADPSARAVTHDGGSGQRTRMPPPRRVVGLPQFTIGTMTDEPDPEPTWIETARRLVSTVGIEVLLAPAGVPGLAAGTVVVLEHILSRKQEKGIEHLQYVAERVGEDNLLGIVQSDDERGEMLWSSTATAMASSHEGKRRYLALVVANAMMSDEPIDMEQLIVSVLEELDGPHIRALALIRKADDANQRNPGVTGDDILHAELEHLPFPVLAALVRTGTLRQGSEQRSNGLVSRPRAETLSISGVSDFGRELLENLESVVDSA